MTRNTAWKKEESGYFTFSSHSISEANTVARTSGSTSTDRKKFANDVNENARSIYDSMRESRSKKTA